MWVAFTISTSAIPLSFSLDIDMERVADETDVLIVGGGPAGLTTAIKLKQLAAETGTELRVTLVEKASEMGKLQTHGSFHFQFIMGYDVPAAVI